MTEKRYAAILAAISYNVTRYLEKMKFLLSKQLGSWAFFSTLAATLGTWSLAAWMTLSGVLIEFQNPDEADPQYGTLSFVFIGCAGVLLIAAFVLNLLFGSKQLLQKERKLFWGVILLGAGILTGGVFLLSPAEVLMTAFGLVLLSPLLLFYRNWKLLIPCLICYALAITGWHEYIVFAISFFDFWTIKQDTLYAANSFLTGFANVFLLAGLALQAEIYAECSKTSRKEIFSLPGILLILLFAVTWCFSLALSFHSEAGAAQGARDYRQVDEAFQQKLQTICRNAEKNVQAPSFWEKMLSLNEQFRSSNGPQGFRIFYALPHINLPKNKWLEWEKFFQSSKEIHELEKMFSNGLPRPGQNFTCCFWRYADACDLERTFYFCRMQLWKLNFALKSPAPRKAVKYLAHLDEYRQFLIAKPYIFNSFFNLAELEESKQRAVEKLLACHLLNEDEIKKQIQICSSVRKLIGYMEEEMIATHGAMFSTCLNHQEEKFPVFVFPPFKHIYNQLRKAVTLSYRGESFDSVRKKITESAGKNLFKTLLPGLSWSDSFKETATRLLVLEAILRLELEKIETGSYPDSAPAWLPPDPYTGNKLHYRKGKIPFYETTYLEQENRRTSLLRRVKGVAVWSEGEFKNDEGIGFNEKPGCDDIRAMIRLD